MELRESAVFSGNLRELECKTLKRKKVLATLKVLWSVIEDMPREISLEDADKLISEMKKVMQKDAARTEDAVAYNIIPLVPCLQLMRLSLSRGEGSDISFVVP